MDPIAAASLAATAIGALSGRNSAKKADMYDTNAAGSLGNTAALAPRYSGVTNTDGSAYNMFAPRATAATNAYVSRLGYDPYSQDSLAAKIGTSGVNNYYDAAGAQDTAELARRGITQSNVGAGAIVANNAARAGALGQIGTQFGMAHDADITNRAAQAAAALNNASNTSRGYYVGDLGNEEGLNQTLFNGNLTLANGQRQIANQEQAGQSSLFGSIGNLAALLLAQKQKAAGIASGTTSGATSGVSLGAAADPFFN